MNEDKNYRLDRTHKACSCNIGSQWWLRGRKGRSANLSSQPSMQPIDPILYDILEGEEKEENSPVQGCYRGHNQRLYGGQEGEVNMPIGLFTVGEGKKENLCAYLDSGANAYV